MISTPTTWGNLRFVTDRFVDYVELGKIKLAPRNPKAHDVDGIGSSMSHHGLGEIPMRDERTGRLVAGHGRIEAIEAAWEQQEEPPEGVRVDDRGRWLVPVLGGWSSRSDEDAEAYLIGSNQWTIAGGWVNTELVTVLSDLDRAQLLGVTGWTREQLDDLVNSLDEEHGGGEGRGTSDGSLLSIADVAIHDPLHVVRTGQVFELGGRHILVVTDVMRGWQLWASYLEDEDHLFVPYPGPYVPHTLSAADYRFVMVQPDIYLAGHILDKWAAIKSEKTIRELTT